MKRVKVRIPANVAKALKIKSDLVEREDSIRNDNSPKEVSQDAHEALSAFKNRINLSTSEAKIINAALKICWKHYS